MPYTVTFWGTRGSIPTPGPHTTRYGGNTPCVAVAPANGGSDRMVILDAGTGIRALGQVLARQGTGGLDVDLLISHTHWDHIQGLPFFAPLFGEGNAVRIWGAQQGEVGLDTVLRQQMHPVVFPVPLEELAASVSVAHVEPGVFEVHGFAARAMRLRHSGHTLGYRLTPADGGPGFAYVTDNELGAGGSYGLGRGWRGDLLSFLDGVSVLVHDTTYTPSELRAHRGWGHSSYEEALTLAREAGIAKLVLFHHRPEHDDRTMDEVVAAARRAASSSDVEVLAATEGLQLTL